MNVLHLKKKEGNDVMKNQIKFICQKNDILFNDLQHNKNVDVVKEFYNINNPLLKFINRIHFSYTINKNKLLPLQFLWDKHNILYDYLFLETRQTIIFVDSVLIYFPISLLKKLKAKHNLVLILLNPTTIMQENNAKAFLKYIDKNIFNLILTFDKTDACKYQIEWINIPYSKYDIVNKSNDFTDICFIGRAKSRYTDLINIFKKVKEHDLKCFFSIIGVSKKEIVESESIQYNKKMSYFEVLEKVNNTNCLLEYVDKTQNAATLRYCEAVCYNKKLLTNYEGVKELPYYNEEYIKIFKGELTEDDITFIKEKCDVNYGYKNEFSPNFLISQIKEMLDVD